MSVDRVKRLVRIYFVQQWFNISDAAVEEVYTTWQRCGILSGLIWCEPAPDETAVASSGMLLE